MEVYWHQPQLSAYHYEKQHLYIQEGPEWRIYMSKNGEWSHHPTDNYVSELPISAQPIELYNNYNQAAKYPIFEYKMRP